MRPAAKLTAAQFELVEADLAILSVRLTDMPTAEFSCTGCP
jgi:hypothetical protein